MDNILIRLCNSHELVELYMNEVDCDKFDVGFVVGCSDNEFLVHAFSEFDQDDGYFVAKNESLCMLQQGTAYLDNMMRLIKSKPRRYNIPQGYWSELDFFNEVYNLCMQEHLMCEVRLESGKVCYGWIEHHDDDLLVLERVDEDGKSDGTTYIPTMYVEMVAFGGLETRRRTKLHNTAARQCLTEEAQGQHIS